MFTDCYANNGSLYENTAATYVPCNVTAVENGGHSTCCAIGNLCMSNGLCMEVANEAKGANHYWRNGCTDKTFKDPACANYCRGKEEPNHYNAFIFYCYEPKDEFCCTPVGTLDSGVSGRNTSCCNDKDAVFTADPPLIFATASSFIPRVTSASSSRLTSSTSTSSSGSSASTSAQASSSATESGPNSTGLAGAASQTPASSESGGISTGAKAGLGVGITLGVLAILAIIGTVFFMRRRKANRHDEAVLLSDSKANPPPYVTYESAGTVRAELEGTMLPAEMHHLDKAGDGIGESTPPSKEATIQRYS